MNSADPKHAYVPPSPESPDADPHPSSVEVIAGHIFIARPAWVTELPLLVARNMATVLSETAAAQTRRRVHPSVANAAPDVEAASVKWHEYANDVKLFDAVLRTYQRERQRLLDEVEGTTNVVAAVSARPSVIWAIRHLVILVRRISRRSCQVTH